MSYVFKVIPLKEHEINKILQIIETDIWNRRNQSGQRFNQTVWRTYHKIENIGNMGKYFHSHDFHDLISTMPLYLNKNWKDFTKSEFLGEIKRRLSKHRKYEFYFIFPHIENYPSGIQIGYCESLRFIDLPKNVQDSFEDFWKRTYEFDKQNFEKTLKQFTDRRKTYLFLKMVVEAFGAFTAIDVATKFVDDSVHLLRVIYRNYIEVNDYVYLQTGSKHAMSLGRYSGIYYNYRAFYQPIFKKMFEEMSEVFLIVKPTDIQQRVKKAITIFGISNGVRYDEVKLSLLCSALESMYLSESDRDYLGWKLAERVTYIIKTRLKRIDVNKRIIKLYSLRSGFVHQKKQQEMIQESDLRVLEFFVQSSIEKFLDLNKKGFTTLSPVNGMKSIIELIDSKKYGHKIK